MAEEIITRADQQDVVPGAKTGRPPCQAEKASKQSNEDAKNPVASATRDEKRARVDLFKVPRSGRK